MGCRASKPGFDTNATTTHQQIVGRQVLGRSRSARVADRSVEVARNTIGQSSQSRDDQVEAISYPPSDMIEAHMVDIVKNSAKLFSALQKCFLEANRDLKGILEVVESKPWDLESWHYVRNLLIKLYEQFKYVVSSVSADINAMPEDIRKLSEKCNTKARSIETSMLQVGVGAAAVQIGLVSTGMIMPVALPIVLPAEKIVKRTENLVTLFCNKKLKNLEEMNMKIQKVRDKTDEAEVQFRLEKIDELFRRLVWVIDGLNAPTIAGHHIDIHEPHGLVVSMTDLRLQFCKVEPYIKRILESIRDLDEYMSN